MEGEFANWSNGVAGNFGALAGLASSGPSAAVLLNGWPHEALGDELSPCLNSWVTEEMQGVEDLTAVRWDVWARFTRRGVAVQLD